MGPRLEIFGARFVRGRYAGQALKRTRGKARKSNDQTKENEREEERGEMRPKGGERTDGAQATLQQLRLKISINGRIVLRDNLTRG